MARWNNCNIFNDAPDSRRLWQFDARKFNLTRELAVATDQKPPAKLIEKSWGNLFQPRLNVALLPADSVFLRVIQLPAASFAETVSMVEFQLEKLSPIPVGQVVWTVQQFGETRALVPKPSAEAGESPAGQQTLIVTLAERKAVEEFLGRLESQGFLADRLELSAFDLLQSVHPETDGAWVFPGALGLHGSALIGWWYGGVLQNINIVTALVEGDRVAALKEQLSQMTWAGELEGWLTSPPAWHLVANEADMRDWESPLRQAVDQPVKTSPPPPAPQLAALTARRATGADPKVNLLPPEFATRYRDDFIDRLWSRGLFSIGFAYLMLGVVYFAILSVRDFKVGQVEQQARNMSVIYTNAVQQRELYNVLKVRQELKFAALDCWRAIAERLPEDTQLDSLSFQDGRTLRLNGTAPLDKVTDVLTFSSEVRKAKANNEPLFETSGGDAFQQHTIPPGNVVGWSFSLDLKRVEGL